MQIFYNRMQQTFHTIITLCKDTKKGREKGRHKTEKEKKLASMCQILVF
jgi:hypothetical protein